MSHVTAIDLEIKDLDALAAACHELGLFLQRNNAHWRWFGRWVDDYDASDAAYRNGYPPALYGTGEHAISVPGSSYDIGVCRIPDTGKLTLIYDFYGHNGRTIREHVGPACEKLKQIYGVHAALNAARQAAARAGRSFSFSRSVKADGSHVLTLNA